MFIQEPKVNKNMDRQQSATEFCANCCGPSVRTKGNEEEGTRLCLKEEQQQLFFEIFIQTGSEVGNSLFYHKNNVDRTLNMTHHRPTRAIKVNQVLASIYKLDYLFQFTGTREQESIAVCRRCADKLVQLCNIYNEFNDLRRLDSYLAKKLTELDVVMQSHSGSHHNNNNISLSRNEPPHEEEDVVEAEISDNHDGDDDNLYTTNKDTFDSNFEIDSVSVCAAEVEISTLPMNPIESTSAVDTGQQQGKKTSSEQVDCGIPEDDSLDINSGATDDEQGDTDFNSGKDVQEELSLSSDDDDDHLSTASRDSRNSKSEKERPFKCPKCDKSYQTVEGLRLHSYTHTDDPEPYHCPVCSKGFQIPSRRNEHLSEAHKGEPIPPKSHKCSHGPCEKAFYSAIERKRHERKRHLDEIKRPFACSKCARKFPYEESLKRHVCAMPETRLKKTGTSETGLTCTLCRKQLGSKSALRTHMLVIHATNLLLCSHCGDGGFRSEKSLSRHVAVRHTKLLPFKCDQCDYSCYAKPGLQSHLVNRHFEKRFQCPDCGKSFGLERSLKRHQAIHTASGIYLCTACGKAFQIEQYLNQHFAMMHRDHGQQKCSVCDMTFKSRQAKQRHELIHSGKTKICSHCGKAFAKAQGLRRHLLTHTREKPYKCTLCPVTFSGNRPLKKHMLTHQTEEEASLDS